ncbi:RagB/SusD family nutrient uptake outer membrane protein [Parabacteroides pacaensis]|uniref:RagB/SusD family nutrient uptake outer membrane protein n=1 Tax=Parabacteroides pacaensis TaxID=2086575 RepID=UPI000D0F50F5|nr:RagB/SusD family nutrient uptake outer membrane protein [Parabacteroides pacaensis]
MKKNLFKSIYLSSAMLMLASCAESWLKPEPLSFYEPNITFSTVEGLEGALTRCRSDLLYYFLGTDGTAMSTELIFSDVAVSAISDLSGSQNFANDITPTSNNGWIGSNLSNAFWSSGVAGSSFANTVISRIPDIDMDQTVKNQMLSRAYFHRAWRYYHLIFQFGDVPLVTREITTPKLDFRSVKMEVVIEKMVKDLEFAAENLPLRDDWGKENKGTALMLLIKYYLAAGRFDKAIHAANTLINDCGYELMEEPFGTFENPYPNARPMTRNVLWDLHRPVNKSIAANKESIMTIISRYENPDSRVSTMFLYNFTPFWSMTDVNRGILTPSKLNAGMGRLAGTSAVMSQYPEYIDYRAVAGRGECFVRPTYFAEKSMWSDSNDLRHNSETGNWFEMEEFKYNNTSLVGTEDEKYFMKPIQKYADDGTLLCQDTIRCWYGYPYYKLWVDDVERNVSNGYTGVDYRGGPGDAYLYRLAEAYLLRAEAYYWAGDYAKAADDVNKIRKRAGCTQLFTAGELNGLDGLDIIMDERARELMYEEFRHVELVRVSFIKANKEGTYESPKSLADESSNSYWWHRITKYNNYYNKGIFTLHHDEYKIAKHNIFWPVTQSNIDPNLYGRINQNYGYAGYEKNEPPISSLTELEESGQ